VSSLLDYLQGQLALRESQSLSRHRRIAESGCAPHQRMTGVDGVPQDLLAFCSNDYLGLAAHPLLVEALAEGARRYGAGSGASHLISGHSRAHEQLEDDIAALLSPHLPEARAVSFSTGYMANLAVLTALGDEQTTIYADLLNHASLIDGARLARAAAHSYAHLDLAGLDRRLAGCSTPRKLIVTDGVFSMDGDLAKLPELLALAERHDAWIVVDDAHGFGVLGEHGRGCVEHFGLRSERFVVVGTLGKAAGVAGAFVAAHRTVIDWLVQSARAYIYTTASPPAVAHAVSESLRLITGDEGSRRRRHLSALIARLRRDLPVALGDTMARRGWHLADSSTAIQPLVVGESGEALALASALESRGVWVPAIRPPTVRAGSARLRITLSAAHTAADVDRLLSGLAQAAAGLGVADRAA
jgi:8-amino-7-oxononanoate synthase